MKPLFPCISLLPFLRFVAKARRSFVVCRYYVVDLSFRYFAGVSPLAGAVDILVLSHPLFRAAVVIRGCCWWFCCCCSTKNRRIPAVDVVLLLLSLTGTSLTSSKTRNPRLYALFFAAQVEQRYTPLVYFSLSFRIMELVVQAPSYYLLLLLLFVLFYCVVVIVLSSWWLFVLSLCCCLLLYWSSLLLLGYCYCCPILSPLKISWCSVWVMPH